MGHVTTLYALHIPFLISALHLPLPQCTDLSSRLQQEHSSLSNRATEVNQLQSMIEIKSAALQDLEAEVSDKQDRIQVGTALGALLPT